MIIKKTIIFFSLLLLAAAICSPAVASELYFEPSTLTPDNGTSSEVTIYATGIAKGIAGYNILLKSSEPGVASINSVDFPDWAVLKSNSDLPGEEVWIKAVDLQTKVEAGGDDPITLAKIQITADGPGTTEISFNNVVIDQDGGDLTIIDGKSLLQITVPGGNQPAPTSSSYISYSSSGGSGSEEMVQATSAPTSALTPGSDVTDNEKISEDKTAKLDADNKELKQKDTDSAGESSTESVAQNAVQGSTEQPAEKQTPGFVLISVIMALFAALLISVRKN